MVERYCKKCGKLFIPAPQHRYKDENGIYCSWACYNHRNNYKPSKSRKVRKVELYSEFGYLLKVFTSATAAAEETGYNVSKIWEACREQKTYKGFIWKYRE